MKWNWDALTCLVSIRIQAGLLLQTHIQRERKGTMKNCKTHNNKRNDWFESFSVLLYKRVVSRLLQRRDSFAVFQGNLQERCFIIAENESKRDDNNEYYTFKIGSFASSASKITDLEQIFNEPLVRLCVETNRDLNFRD